MDFIQAINQLGEIAGSLKFEPIWEPYKGDKPVWIACEGLTEKDARVGMTYIKNFLTVLETPFEEALAWECKSPKEWHKSVKPSFKEGGALVSLGAPLFRFAYFGSPQEAFKDAPLDRAYKILCYASNFSHNVAAEDKSRTEAQLVQIRKQQKRMLQQNAGDFDLQLVLNLTEGVSMDLTKAKKV